MVCQAEDLNGENYDAACSEMEERQFPGPGRPRRLAPVGCPRCPMGTNIAARAPDTAGLQKTAEVVHQGTIPAGEYQMPAAQVTAG